MKVPAVEPALRSSMGISPQHHLEMSRLCISIREKGGKGKKNQVFGKMIEYFNKHPEALKHIVI